MTLNEWTILDAAHAALRNAVSGVGDDRWGSRTPCESWDVAQVLQHAAGDQCAYAAVLTGSGFPVEDPFSPSGTLGAPGAELLEPALVASAAAFAAVDPDATAVAVPLPQGQLPAPTAVGACALDAAIHAWDIAVATGQEPPLDDELATRLLPVARSIVEPLRGFAYAAALPAVESDAPADALLRYLGRDPRWSPAG